MRSPLWTNIVRPSVTGYDVTMVFRRSPRKFIKIVWNIWLITKFERAWQWGKKLCIIHFLPLECCIDLVGGEGSEETIKLIFTHWLRSVCSIFLVSLPVSVSVFFPSICHLFSSSFLTSPFTFSTCFSFGFGMRMELRHPFVSSKKWHLSSFCHFFFSILFFQFFIVDINDFIRLPRICPVFAWMSYANDWTYVRDFKRLLGDVVLAVIFVVLLLRIRLFLLVSLFQFEKNNFKNQESDQ